MTETDSDSIHPHARKSGIMCAFNAQQVSTVLFVGTAHVDMLDLAEN
ncbi:MAG: hypothetical protein ACR2N7_00520 [Acidimicrobiia bacterium]